jgi:hypothetical protein
MSNLPAWQYLLSPIVAEILIYESISVNFSANFVDKIFAIRLLHPNRELFLNHEQVQLCIQLSKLILLAVTETDSY